MSDIRNLKSYTDAIYTNSRVQKIKMEHLKKCLN